jgi:hypothetical protein
MRRRLWLALTGFIWLRIRASGGISWTRWWITLGIPQTAGYLLPSRGTPFFTSRTSIHGLPEGYLTYYVSTPPRSKHSFQQLGLLYPQSMKINCLLDSDAMYFAVHQHFWRFCCTILNVTDRVSRSGTQPAVPIVTPVRTLHRREIWGSHSGVDEDSTLLWHDVCTGVQLPRFKRNLLPLSSAFYTRRQTPFVSNVTYSVYSYACCLGKRDRRTQTPV